MQWLIYATLAVAGWNILEPVAIAKWAWTKLKPADTSDDPFADPPEVVDDMPLLVHQMRLCVCDEPPRIRDGCNQHLDEIEQLISGTEVAPSA